MAIAIDHQVGTIVGIVIGRHGVAVQVGADHDIEFLVKGGSGLIARKRLVLSQRDNDSQFCSPGLVGHSFHSFHVPDFVAWGHRELSQTGA
jgi:hypothetical protein